MSVYVATASDCTDWYVALTETIRLIEITRTDMKCEFTVRVCKICCFHG